MDRINVMKLIIRCMIKKPPVAKEALGTRYSSVQIELPDSFHLIAIEKDLALRRVCGAEI